MLDNKIITVYRGGLGNQMFQYLYAEYLSVITGFTNFADLSTYSLDARRNFELTEIFDLDVQERKYLFGIKNTAHIHGFPKVISKLIHRVEFDNPISHILDTSIHPHVALDGTIILDGYWQDAELMRTAIRKCGNRFKFRHENSYKKNAIFELISGFQCIGIHVRRGDYISNKQAAKLNGFLGKEYIEGAIAKVHRLIGDGEKTKIIFFSDDIRWCEESFHGVPNTYFSHAGIDSGEDIFLMSQCHHLIISNSTYSWWAGFLSSYPEKICIYPRSWFADGITESSLQVDEWILN